MSRRPWGRLALLLLVTVIFLGPLLFMVVGAFKPSAKVLGDSNSIRVLYPTDGSVRNFGTAIHAGDYFLLLRNSAIIAFSTVLIGLVVNSMFGYALARLDFPTRRAMLLLVIATAIIPFQAVAIPLLYLVSELGWRNTFWVQILPFVASPFFTYFFYTFFLGIPRDLEEAAFIDGAGRLRIFFGIVVPISGPAFATVGVLGFLFSWGELLWPALVTDAINVRPLPLGLSAIRSFVPVDHGAIMAFALMMAIPLVAVFLVLQRWVVRSMATTGLRG